MHNILRHPHVVLFDYFPPNLGWGSAGHSGRTDELSWGIGFPRRIVPCKTATKIESITEISPNDNDCVIAPFRSSIRTHSKRFSGVIFPLRVRILIYYRIDLPQNLNLAPTDDFPGGVVHRRIVLFVTSCDWHDGTFAKLRTSRFGCRSVRTLKFIPHGCCSPFRTIIANGTVISATKLIRGSTRTVVASRAHVVILRLCGRRSITMVTCWA
mmetsp:Transcript_16080/g.23583  ORF Transcript_16080/g.23583 Transcript_16080/m.23583 type:complete len:212 (-) Transcript_16080:188-823(-)